MISLIDEKSHRLLKSVSLAGLSTFKKLQVVVHNTVTLSKRLQGLCNFNLIKSHHDGYSITSFGESVLEAFDTITGIVNLSINDLSKENFSRIPLEHVRELLQSYVVLLMNHFGDRLLTVILFGSFGRGTWNSNSDIDLLVIVKDWDIPSHKRFRELRTVYKQLIKLGLIKVSLKNNNHYPLSHYPLSNEEVGKNHPVFYDIFLDGIVLYEKDLFAQEFLNSIRLKLLSMKAKCVITPAKQRYWICQPILVGQ